MRSMVQDESECFLTSWDGGSPFRWTIATCCQFTRSEKPLQEIAPAFVRPAANGPAEKLPSRAMRAGPNLLKVRVWMWHNSNLASACRRVAGLLRIKP